MKNKKLLNFYMLTIALLSFISFLLPFEQIALGSTTGVVITVLYYTLNAIMCLALVLIIVIALINLFKDDYGLVNVMKALSLIAFFMVMVVLFIYATQLNYALGWGYVLIAMEVFLLFALVPIIRMASAFKDISRYMKKAFPKTEKPAKKVVVKESKKDAKVIKKNKNKEVKAQQADTKTEATQVADPTTGEQ